MAKDKKYRLVRTKKMAVNNNPEWKPIRFYQLVALVDIPLHNVKAGDLGGYVTARNALSHEGSCWIGEQAQVIDGVKVQGDAYVGGNVFIYNPYGYPLVIKDEARVQGNATVALTIDESGSRQISPTSFGTTIGGKAIISGSVLAINVQEISGFAKISGNAQIYDAKIISGNADISGDVEINEFVKILGDTRISGKSIIGASTTVRDCSIADTQLAPYSEFKGIFMNSEEYYRLPEKETVPYGKSVQKSISKAVNQPENTVVTPEISLNVQRIRAVYQEVIDGIASYETDIVKIIKYPVMTDRTNPYTREMVKCMKDAQYFADHPESKDFAMAVRALEDAYFNAESNALKIAATELSEEARKKTVKAKDLLAVAANEASTEHEKKVSFKQAFKQLEGVIVVPEAAIDAFQVKVGLKEIETL